MIFFGPSPHPQGTMWGFLVTSRCIFILIMTLTTKKLDFKNSHLTSVGANRSLVAPTEVRFEFWLSSAVSHGAWLGWRPRPQFDDCSRHEVNFLLFFSSTTELQLAAAMVTSTRIIIRCTREAVRGGGSPPHRLCGQPLRHIAPYGMLEGWIWLLRFLATPQGLGGTRVAIFWVPGYRLIISPMSKPGRALPARYTLCRLWACPCHPCFGLALCFGESSNLTWLMLVDLLH
jgi:hypothetical protein